MKAIIVGAGKVGFNLASTLASKSYDVLVIDTSEERLRMVEEYLDVQTLEGNGGAMSVLEEAGVDEADLVVAVTDIDELNMMTCFIAKSYGVKSTIARVRKPGYDELVNSVRQKQLGIDLIINPDLVAAQEIAKLIVHPEAHDVDYYADGRVVLLGLKIEDHYKVANKALKDISFVRPCVVVAILRDDKVIVPNGDTVILPKDEIFMLSATKDMRELEVSIGVKRCDGNDIAIFGGGLIGFYLAMILEGKKTMKLNMKIFEEDEDVCFMLDEKLKKTAIIKGSGKDKNLMEDENIADMDIVVAVNDSDEENVLSSIIAKHLGAQKVISQIRRSDYVSMIESFGIDKAISPRRLMVATILRFINRGRIQNLKLLEDDLAQMHEIEVSEGAKIAGKPLKNLRFPKHSLVALIVRGDKIIVPNGNDCMLEGDHVMTFAQSDVAEDVIDFLSKGSTAE